MRPNVVIWGASAHALVVAEILRLRDEYSIVGLLDDVNPERRGQQLCGVPVLGGREQLASLHDREVTHFIFGFGQCAGRLNLSSLVRDHGFGFATAIHPRAIISAEAQIGEGTVITAGAVVNRGSTVGANSIINTCASVDHDCELGDAVHIGPGARLGGRVRIGAAAWIGIGATILDRCEVGAHSIVGAGSIVTKNLEAEIVAYGSPARKVRSVSAQNRLWQERAGIPSSPKK